MCTLRGNDLRILYDEIAYVAFMRKRFTCLLRGKSLRGFYDEIVDPNLRPNLSS